MKSWNFTLFSCILFAFNTLAQAPIDYLSKEFHKERRDILRSKMPKNSVAVLFANLLFLQGRSSSCRDATASRPRVGCSTPISDPL